MAHLEPPGNIMLTAEQTVRIAANKDAAMERKAEKERRDLYVMVLTPAQKIRIAVNKKAAQDRKAARMRKCRKEATRAKNAEIVFQQSAKQKEREYERER